MTLEDHHADRKSLRKVSGRTADWDDVARACVCFANGAGGRLLIGIEDGETLPPAGQVVPPDLLDRLRKRIGELTVNVQALPSVRSASNGGGFIELVVERSPSVASTRDGRYFLRVGDTCQPVLGDDVLRLANERPGRSWESMDSGVSRLATDADMLAHFVQGIRASDRVKESVKEKSDHELLTHYALAQGNTLTRLGVLLLGRMADRAALGTAPLEGMFRRSVPAYDEKVVRELLVNALVHRPYTQHGDIYLNLHPDRLEVVNSGRLPLGVTPRNILHASRRRNEGLARVFHDLGLMEREGSGYDLMYDRLLSQGRPAPLPEEGTDWVKVTIQRRIVNPAVMRLIAEADARFQLTQRERITLGALAQTEGMTARELATLLETESAEALALWFGRLSELGLVLTSGRTQGTRYFVDPALLKDSGVKLPTSLKRIEPHRLSELVREDLRRYPNSKIGEISSRIGSEINRSRLRRTLAQMVLSGAIVMDGQRKGARYRLRDDS